MDVRIVLVVLFTIVSALQVRSTTTNIVNTNVITMAPLTPVTITMAPLTAVTITMAPLQYYIAWFNFEAAISQLATVPKYRLQVSKLDGVAPI